MMRSEVAHRGDLGIGDHDGDVGMAHGELGATLDAGGAVADHPVEFLSGARRSRRSTPSSVSASLSRVCEAASRCRVFKALVADQRLRELGVALDDVDEVVDHAALGAEDQIEIAQADVEIDHGDAVARHSPALHRGRRSMSSCRRLPYRT